jgi:hypothetical protein
MVHFGFVVFWQKDIGEKAARKMLMKLTTGRAVREPPSDGESRGGTTSFPRKD